MEEAESTSSLSSFLTVGACEHLTYRPVDMLPKPVQTASPTGDEAFKCLRLWVTLIIQAYHSAKCIKQKCLQMHIHKNRNGASMHTALIQLQTYFEKYSAIGQSNWKTYNINSM